MKLTELRDKINEALRLHDNYGVKIIAENFIEDHILEIDTVGIAVGRFNFHIRTDITSLIDSYTEAE